MDHYHSHGDPYYGVLELCLNDILSYIKPSESDRLKRLNTINELTTIVRSMESLKDVGVRPFGSFISNMYTKWGDLDAFIELSHVSPSCTGKRQKQKVLLDIMRVLRRNGPWSSLERQIEDGCAANIERFKSFRQRNQSTLCQLLISFFDKFSRIESLSSDYAICTYTGQWEMMSSNPRWTEKPHDLLIEDPFERPDNAARAVGLRTLCVISEAFMTAYQKLSSYSVLSDRNALLDCLVRPDMRAQIHYGTRENQKEPQPAYSGYATFHEFSEVSSQHKIGTQNRYNGRENPEEPQLAYSGYATAHEFSEVSSECKVGTQSRSTAKQNRKGDTPQVAFSGYAVRAPDHEKIQEAVDNHNSQSSPSVITRQRQEYTTNWELGTPQVAFSGYAVCAPDHEKIQEAVNNHNGQASPSVIAGQRQGYRHEQQIWRPKNPSR